MADPHFYLKDTKSKTETLIKLYYKVSGERFIYSTKVKVNPKLWSKAKERILPRHPNAETLNSRLDRLKVSVVDEYEIIADAKGYVSKQDLKEALDIAIGEKRSSDTFYSFFDQLIEERKASTRFKNSTVRSYGSARNLIKEFAGGKEIDFRDFNYQMWQSFQEFLINKEYSANYAHKILGRIKAVLRDASKKGIAGNINLGVLDNSIKSEETTAIYLSSEEIDKLYRIDYSSLKRWEKARDLFIVGAVTGLRYSDFSRITSEDIRIVDQVEVLDFVGQKTGKQVIIPVHPYLRSILEKYEGKMPKLSQQKMNDYLKELGKDCGFLNDKINKVITIGNEKTSKMVPRHELFSTHTARRSFATNAYLAGWNLLSIMLITGHSSEKQLLRYIRVSEEENAVRVAKENIVRTEQQFYQAIEGLKYLIENAERYGLDRVVLVGELGKLDI